MDLFYNLYFDIKYIISLINRTFLSENHSTSKIKKIFTLIIIKEVNNNKYKISEYIKTEIYLLIRIK